MCECGAVVLGSGGGARRRSGGGGGGGGGGKIVYLAPLRALAAERQADWSAKFAAAGLRVVSLTGDDDAFESGGGGGGGGGGEEDPNEAGGGAPTGLGGALPPAPPRGWLSRLAGADVIVTTPEKWDAVTRRWRDNVGLIAQIELLCIDEVHLLGEDRGAVLEAVVSRMATVSQSEAVRERGWPAARLRIVAVSATLPNLGDVAAWIRAPPSGTFAFDGSFRPVPLTMHVIG
jgi:ATP-dependent DNA helicase HFM1/MER3